MNPEEKDKAILYFANMVTKRIKKVAKNLELDEEVIKKISSYASRHTFASTLMKKSAPAAYIKQQLGHTSLETTTNYLSSFEDKQLEEWQEKLTEF
jgi:integrase